MKFDGSNKFYLRYQGQVNSLQQQSSVVSFEMGMQTPLGGKFFFWRWYLLIER